MKPLCVAFDLDDTIFLERDYVRSGFAAVDRWVRTEFGLENFLDRAWDLFQGGRRGKIFDLVLREASLPTSTETIAKMVGIYRAHIPDIRLTEDAAGCLRMLSGRARLSLISDGPVESQRKKVKALALDGLFDHIVLTAELGNGFGKPHRRAFELVEELSSASGMQCLYVADNPAKDFFAPVQLGWRTVRVRRQYGLYASIEIPPHISVELEMPNLVGLPKFCLEEE